MNSWRRGLTASALSEPLARRSRVELAIKDALIVMSRDEGAGGLPVGTFGLRRSRTVTIPT